MAELNRKKLTLTLGLSALAASVVLGLGACNIQEKDDGSKDGGIVVSVSDSSSINMEFDKTTPQTYTDSGEFDLDEIRARMSDKGISADDVKITGLAVEYDATTLKFLTDNAGVHFVLQIFTREGIAEKKLTLETGDATSGALAALAFDPKMTLFELNKQIFGNEAGFPGLLSSIKDTSKHKVKVIAEVKVKDSLKSTGALKVNVVVTVAGKV